MKKEQNSINNHHNIVCLGIGVLLGIAIAGLIAFLVLPQSDRQNSKALISASNAPLKNAFPCSLSELLLLPTDQIHSVDCSASDGNGQNLSIC